MQSLAKMPVGSVQNSQGLLGFVGSGVVFCHGFKKPHKAALKSIGWIITNFWEFIPQF